MVSNKEWIKRMRRLARWASPAEGRAPPRQWDLPLGKSVGQQPAPVASAVKKKSVSFVAYDPHAECSIEGQPIIETEVVAEMAAARAAGRSTMTIEDLERSMAPWSAP
jgi:hypothetical protein